MYDVAKAVEELSKAIGGFFVMRKIEIEQQSTTETLRTKKELKKASNISEKIILIASKYKSKMDKRDLKAYDALVKAFYKFN